jgi:acyl-CoA synthetase (AMP-forming)/AMP-acid ligase II
MADSQLDTYAHLLRRHAAERPDAPALTVGEQTWTYARLAARSAQTAQALLASGVQPGDRVAVLTRNCAEYYELIHACGLCGAILVGLNWRLAAAEIAAIVADARPVVAIVGPQERDLLDPDNARAAGIRRVVALGPDYEAWRAPAPLSDPGHVGAAEEVAMLLYTSGTTGLPKGVMLTNENLSYTRRLGQVWGMGPASVNLVAMPMFHIGGTGYGMSTMAVGGHTVLVREVDPPQIVQAIGRHRVTHAFFVPAVVQMLLQVPGVEQADWSSLQLLMYGASPIGEVLLREAMRVMRCNFIQAYGMTETAGTIVDLFPPDHDPDGPRAGLLRSCGRALPWVELRIVDPATARDLPVGEVGEVWVRSRMVMKGYWNQPAATRETIVQDGWLRTGDAAYQDAEGYVFLYDRYKDMIISGGENVYPAEVENALAHHPALLEAAAIGVPDARWGETVKAVVVLRPGQQATEREIIDFARTRLAKYKCPTSVDFMDTLPRNASGKLLKRELRRIYWKEQDRGIA